MTESQVFSLPGMVDYDLEEYSYHNQIYKIIQAKKKLDQQVMFGELFKLFTSQSDLISFTFKVDCYLNDTNKYNNTITFENVVSHKELNLHPDTHLKTTVNYLTSNNQIQIIEWAMDIAQKNNLVYSFEQLENGNKLFSFYMNNRIIDKFTQEAYGENYPSFFKQYLDKTLQQPISSKKNNVKI